MLESELWLRLSLWPALWSALSHPALVGSILDSAICRATTASGRWAAFTWGVLSWLFSISTNPTVVLPLLLALILLPWFVRAIPRKRQISGFGMLLLLLYGFTCSGLGMRVGNRVLVMLLPSDSGQPADAIVVLGRGPELRLERSEVAVQLWQAQRAPIVFASGRGDAQPIGDLLAQSGVAPEAIEGEPCSRTTEENAQFTAALLQPQGVQKILLVTDPPHMLRSWLTFRSFGFEVIPHPNPLPPSFSSRKKAFLLVREYLGLVSYSALGRFLPREAPPVTEVS